MGSEIKIDPIQTGVNFSINGNGKTEVVIFLVDDSNMDVKYKLVIGAQDDSVTYLSEITKGKLFCFILLLINFSTFFFRIETPLFL